MLQENCLWGTVPSGLTAADPRGALSVASALALGLGLSLGHRADGPREGVWFGSRKSRGKCFWKEGKEDSGFIMKQQWLYLQQWLQ